MATLKDTIVLGNLSTTGTLNATTIYEGGTSLVDKYAAKSHTHTKSEVGLGNVDNTADANKTVDKANLLNPHQNVSSTNKSSWDPTNSGKIIWGQGFINNSISSDSGDLTLFLRKSQYNANGTELCMNIDGDYYSFGKKVIHSGGGTLTGNLEFQEIYNGTFPVSSSAIIWRGSTDHGSIFYRLDASDAGRLVFKTGDDANCNFVWTNSVSGDLMQLTGTGELTLKGTKVALEGKIISRATSLPTASESSKDFVEVNSILYKKVKTGSSSYEYKNTDDSYPEIIDLT